MDPNIRREIILDNYNNPFHKRDLSEVDYEEVRTNNESCIDDLTLKINIEDNIIKDIYFDGEACAISTSVTSIAIRSLTNKTIDEALNIIDNYENMLYEKPYDKELLGELNVYDEIYKQPNRLKCAFLPFTGIREVLNNHKNS